MRYSKASNKYLKFYDPKQGSKHVIYLDPNIYIHMVMQCLNFIQKVNLIAQML